MSGQKYANLNFLQGVGGSVQYPKGYIANAFQKVRSQGGLCVSDEVQTGFGRTGEHFWGFEGHGVVPDIVTMAINIDLFVVVDTNQMGTNRYSNFLSNDCFAKLVLLAHGVSKGLMTNFWILFF